MKVIIIGGVAAGTKVAAKLKREDRSAEVTILTKGKDISYAGCGLPYYVGKVIPDQFQTAYGRFVYQTASALLCENLEDNVIYSPVGLYYALSMAA